MAKMARLTYSEAVRASSVRRLAVVSTLLTLGIVVALLSEAGGAATGRTARVMKSALDRPRTEAATGGDESAACQRRGVILVFFKRDVTVRRQRAIIAKERATIRRVYSSLHGYALNVRKGKERLAVRAFLKHPEVRTANTVNCNSATTP
jgi:hypothetical protein